MDGGQESPSSFESFQGTNDDLVVWIRGMGGAIVGGALGHYAFGWIANQGFRAEMLPGTLLGLGCGLLSGRRSIALGIMCGMLGTTLGVLTEWRFLPFARDGSFGFFMKHFFDLPPIILIMLAAGGLLAYWFGTGKDR